MRKIKLTKGLFAIVDDWNYEYLSRWKWCAVSGKNRNSGYATRRENNKIITMSRFIANTPEGMQCDHINHNTLDNREANLRNVTVSQNMMNRAACKKNALGEKNIRIRKGLYVVTVSKDKKNVFCKCFKSLDSAIVARDEALKTFHGQFAYKSNLD